MKKEIKMQKIKLVRPMIYDGKVTAKGTVLTVPESQAKLYLGSKKAVVAGPQTKDEK